MKKKLLFLLLLTIPLIWMSCSSDDNSIPQATNVKFGNSSEAITVKDSIAFSIKHEPKDLPAPAYKYKSSNPDVAIVKNGKIIALSPGTTTITATVPDTDLSTSVKVTVEAIKAAEVVLNETKKGLTVGEEFQLEATVKPNDAEDKEIAWSSSDEKIVSVDKSGKIRALEKGKTKVTAKTNNGLEATAEITVSAIEVEEIFFDVEEMKLEVGEEFQLKATIEPNDAEDKEITWLSSDEGIVSVDDGGKIRALKKGKAEVTAKTNNDLETTIVIIVQEKVKYNKEVFTELNKRLIFPIMAYWENKEKYLVKEIKREVNSFLLGLSTSKKDYYGSNTSLGDPLLSKYENVVKNIPKNENVYRIQSFYVFKSSPIANNRDVSISIDIKFGETEWTISFRDIFGYKYQFKYSDAITIEELKDIFDEGIEAEIEFHRNKN